MATQLRDLPTTPIEMPMEMTGITFERQRNNKTGEFDIVMRVPANFRVVVDGDHTVEAENIIRNVPGTPDPNRPGYILGIYDACPLDERGQPRAIEDLYDRHGRIAATALGIYHANGVLDKGTDELYTRAEVQPLLSTQHHGDACASCSS